jgi:AraC-like DNA-binding protein
MPVLPVPLIIALLLLALLVHRLTQRETHWTLLTLIGLCAAQSAVHTLFQYYGLSAIRPLQPLLATLIPPMAWFAFHRASGHEAWPRHAWLHGGGFVLALASLLTHPSLLDVLIPASFAAYGVVMLWQLASGEDSLPHSRLESGSLAVVAWRVVGVSLIASAVGDVVIAYYLATGRSGVLLWLPSIASSLTLLCLGAVGLSRVVESRRDDDHEVVATSEEDLERDQMIIARLDSYMMEHKPFLDPDLTLSRLSRKLLVPAKQLSAAINRVKGENVSRYINRQRIDVATHKLEAGQSVTSAMFESGFNTKSNFNREFLRVKNMPPSQWSSTVKP